MLDYIYDIETFPNCFTLTIQKTSSNFDIWQYTISDWNDDSISIRLILEYFKNLGHRMVGFNNLNFDYQVLHYFLTHTNVTARQLYDRGQRAIHNTKNGSLFVPYKSQIIKQLDLYKIHHFDNKARATSLKELEFNMQSDEIQNMPFHNSEMLSQKQVSDVLDYNRHDVQETFKFYLASLDMIHFRDALSARYNHDFTNHNDVRIGKDLVVMALETARPGCCYDPVTRKPRQTKRDSIQLNDCLSDKIHFEHPSLVRVHQWLKKQTVQETKKVFKSLQCDLNGLTLKFGLGGIHGSLDRCECLAGNDDIVDIDVDSYYSSLAINMGLYPAHLGKTFCTVYQSILEKRQQCPDGSPEKKRYKLASVGIFGNSNSTYSPFYDPLYTLSVTLNGQMFMAMLCEQLSKIDDLKIIQINTDGLTLKVPKTKYAAFKQTIDNWQNATGLTLHKSHYKALYLRDVNNYFAIRTDDSIKRKGVYEYQRGWHQNHSALVVPKSLEAYLVNGTPIDHFIKNHKNIHDFMLRIKTNAGHRLEITQLGRPVRSLPKLTRYYVSKQGGELKKIMPPLGGSGPNRIRDVESGWYVTPCNNLKDAVNLIDYDYYIEKAESLILPLERI